MKLAPRKYRTQDGALHYHRTNAVTHARALARQGISPAILPLEPCVDCGWDEGYTLEDDPLCSHCHRAREEAAVHAWCDSQP